MFSPSAYLRAVTLEVVLGSANVARLGSHCDVRWVFCGGEEGEGGIVSEMSGRARPSVRVARPSAGGPSGQLADRVERKQAMV